MMKKILLLLCLFTSITIKAQTPVSIAVFAQDGEKFWLILDGIKQNEKPEANVKVNGLTNENYRLKIIFDDSSLPSIDQTIYTRWGYEQVLVDASYVIIRRERKKKKKNAPEVEYVLKGNSVTEVNAPKPPTNGQSVVEYHTTDDNSQTKPETTTQPTKSGTNNPKPVNNSSSATQCTEPTSAADFNSIKSSIEKQSFANTRFTVAQQMTKNSCLTTAQVIEIMNLFSFENQKIDFAKFAYDYTSDKKNFFNVSEAFTFSASIEELSRFLEKK
jgi:hypothetical protein